MYTKNYNQTCSEIDWTALSAQKQTLLKLKSTLKGKDRKNIEGLIKTITDLQDAATDVHNVSLSKVYPALGLIHRMTMQSVIDYKQVR